MREREREIKRKGPRGSNNILIIILRIAIKLIIITIKY